jgi:hypothetical protein
MEASWKQYLRPGILIWLTVFVCLLALIDGNVGHINIKDSYIKLFEAILMVVYGSFFIGRSVEKVKNNEH